MNSISSENIIYGPQIALAYIYNNNFDNAVNWIELYENAIEVDSKSIYSRIITSSCLSTNLVNFHNFLDKT